mmetsp:Transcript_13409/g.24815  ORF Transcript_13409/g.24815 Transcript_13409/m.24815 type:complete len:204 (-) Transcript_13409:1376-1987(-)
MSKKKGMSAEEKKSVILSIYHEQKVPFNLKEIEGLASKRRVVLQTVKENNQALVDDSLVNCDKIGSSNFFWSFPSAAYMRKRNRVEEVRQAIASTELSIDSQEGTLKKIKAERSDPNREGKLEQLRVLRAENAALEEELAKNKANDPEEHKRVTQEVALLKAGAERWTDNVWAVKSYLVKKRGMAGKEVDKMLGINGDFDYLT